MSLYEMIPDRPLIMPTGAHAARRDSQKKFGLLESTCAYCGEVFYYRGHEVQYIRHKNGKVLRMCSWKHLCRWDEEEEKSKKAKRPTRQKRSAEEVQARIDQLMRDMSKIRAELDSEAGQALSGEEHNKMRSRIRWRVHELKKLLEGLDGADSGGVRGIAGGDDRAEAAGA